jgi:hypothetical protein
MTVNATAEVWGLRKVDANWPSRTTWGVWPASDFDVGDLIATDCVGGWDHPRVVYFSKVLSKSEAGLVIEEPLR